MTTKSAWMSLLTALLRTNDVEWLTEIDPLIRAENKLVVNQVARRAGVPVPSTVVTNSFDALRVLHGPQLLAKPLGPGHFIDRGEAYNVFAHALDRAEFADGSLVEAPFLIQELLQAQGHYRVVTVRQRTWGAYLRADGYPVDWRSAARAHSAFKSVTLPDELARQALTISSALDLGFTSQDWIDTGDRIELLDVNPAGQWLFLPEDVGNAVSTEIANWLERNYE